jgi:hypothetical protein
MSKRATQAELIARRKEIQELILSGSNSVDIVDNMAKKWKTSKRAIAEDMRLIYKEWRETTPQETNQAKNKYVDRLEMLFNKALGENQIKTALEIQKEINKLHGLYNEKEKETQEVPRMIRVKKRSSQIVEDNEQQH